MQKIIIHTDGGARGNPGPAGAGAVVADETGAVLAEISDYLGEATNNVAEYEALERALAVAQDWLASHPKAKPHIEVRMDSELIIKQMTGVYRVKEAKMKEHFLRVAELREALPTITFTHVRREFNKHADRLVNEAIDRGLAQRR